jgi:hypothetical protein
MQRIDTATKAVDLFGAGKHGYKDGNRALGISATDFNAASFNNMQEEICAIIESAGIALNGATMNQLLTALRSAGVFVTQLASDNSTKVATTAWVKLGFSVSIAANGYIKFPDWLGGLIIQWGTTGSIGAGGSLSVTLPLAFPNNNFTGVCMAQYSAAPNTGYMVSIYTRTLSNMMFYNSNTGVALIASWIAIGN